MLRNTDYEKRKINVSQHTLSKSFKYERDNKNNRTTQDRLLSALYNIKYMNKCGLLTKI